MAEGYLDLATSLDSPSHPSYLDSSLREQLADRAIATLDEIKNPLGHKPYVLFLKGQACCTANRPEKAIHFLEQSAKLDPDNLHTHLALAWCYKRTEQLELAIESMQFAVELNSESAIAHYNLACYCALNRQVDLALMHLSFALDLNAEYRAHIAHETDFDLIRENPRFASIASATV
jgi:tetratricopeptide (TPR) repeat protein